MALSTKGLPTAQSNIPKTISPGEILAKIYGIELAADSYTPGGYYLYLMLEGVDRSEEGFQGFFIDKSNESLGRFKGQIGRVNYSQFSFRNSVLKDGTKIDRDENILKAVASLARAAGKEKEVAEVEANTIEEYIPKAAAVLVGDTFIKFVIAGKEYEKAGYTNYNLFLPKAKKGQSGWPFESADVPVDESKLIKFSKEDHIVRKAKPATVDTFEAPVGGFEAVTNDFEI